MFNTFKYAKMLEDVGFSREQAETSIKILVEIMEDKLASKQDIAELKNVVASMATTMATKAELEKGLLQLKHDLTIKMGAMISAAVALTTALHKLI